MPVLILGILALVLGLWALNVVSRVDPKVAARVMKAAGGLLSLGFCVFVGFGWEIGVGQPLGAFCLGQHGWLPFGPAGFSSRSQKSGGQTSRVRSAMLQMELDHDSGAMRGRFTAGPHQGADLDSLAVPVLASLLNGVDEESRALLLAYLDRRDPTWREHAQGDTASRRGFAATGKMTDEEAYQILGVQSGAAAAEITRAHRSLMKKLHPDQGGSTYLAARVNEAKDTLLRRHR